MGLSIQLQQNPVKDKLGHWQCSVVEMKGESGGCSWCRNWMWGPSQVWWDKYEWTDVRLCCHALVSSWLDMEKVRSLGWIWGMGGGHYFRVGDKYCSAAKWVRLDSCQLPTAPAFMQHLIHHHQNCWVTKRTRAQSSGMWSYSVFVQISQ